jgi:hypothetical protein
MNNCWWNQCGWKTEERAGRAGTDALAGLSGPGMKIEEPFIGPVVALVSEVRGISSGESNNLSRGLELLIAI